MPIKAVFDYSNQIRRYSTPIGCLWYFVNVIFRYIIVSGTGRNVYSDGMKEFTCDTKMPGCNNVCHNDFLPIDMDRFWQIEALFICSPTLFFMVYAGYHRSEVDMALEKFKKNDEVKDDTDFEKNFKSANKIKSKQVIVQDKIYDVLWTKNIRWAFVFHLVFRIFLEMVFIALHYQLQKEQNGLASHEYPDLFDVWSNTSLWQVPERYVCKHGLKKGRVSPCYQDEDVICWVARPREKTILVKYMFCIQMISIFLTVAELLFISTKWAFGRHKEKLEVSIAEDTAPSAPARDEVPRRNRIDSVPRYVNRARMHQSWMDNYIKRRNTDPVSPVIPSPPILPLYSTKVLEDEVPLVPGTDSGFDTFSDSRKRHKTLNF